MNRTRKLLLAASLLTGTLLACGDPEPPEPPKPAAPEVVAFTASPERIAPGAEVTFAWTTVNADAIAITIDGTEVARAEGEEAIEGQRAVTLTILGSYLLTATGEGGTATRSVTINGLDAPAITEFVASAEKVREGDEVTLSWRTERATSVVLRDAAGVLASVTDPAQAAQGEHRVTLAAATTFTLEAAGPGGEVSATVEVGLFDEPAIVEFVVEPAEIAIGSSATLRWKTEHAETVSLIARTEAGDVTMPLTGKNAAEDSIEVTPSSTTTYVFTATGPGGEASEETLLTVHALPEILAFTATPDRFPLGDSMTLTWETLGATSVTFTQDGTAIDLGGALSGSRTLTLGSQGEHKFQLTAAGPGGVVPSEVLTVTVLQPRPAFTSFTASPANATVGDELTLTWSATDTDETFVMPFLNDTPISVIPGGAFENIAATGKDLLHYRNDDLKTHVFTDGFTFPFFGLNATRAVVSANGWIGLADPAAYEEVGSGNNTTLPHTADPNAVIAAFWDDLAPKTASKTLVEMRGTAPERRLIVQWNNYGFSGSGTSELTFQAVLFETGAVELRYLTMTSSDAGRATGGSATIGLENPAGSFGFQHASNTVGAIQPGQSLRLVQKIGGASGTVKVTPGEGLYPLRLRAVGPSGAALSVPVEAQVGKMPSVAAFSADRLFAGAGDPIKLSWNTSGASLWRLELDGADVAGVPQQAHVTGFEFRPAKGGTLTLHALNAAAREATKSLTVQVGAPTITEWSVSPSGQVAVGTPLTFTWKTSGGQSLEVDDGSGAALVSKTDPADRAAMASGTYATTARNGSIEYRLEVVNGSGATRQTLTVVASSDVAIDSFTATPTTVTAGEPVRLDWKLRNAASAIVSVVGATEPSGGFPYAIPPPMLGTGHLQFVAPAADTTYRLTAGGDGGPQEQDLVLTVLPRPQVVTFTAEPMFLAAGGQTTLSWTTENADSVTIRTADGTPVAAGLPAQGSHTITPAATTTYVAHALNAQSVSQAGPSVEIIVAAEAPVVTAALAPGRIPRGASSTLSWTATNVAGVSISPMPLQQQIGGFEDISQTGTELILTTNAVPGGTVNKTSGAATIAFPGDLSIPFYGNRYTGLWVSSRGFVGFEPSYADLSSNVALSAATAPKNVIAPFWDDVYGIASSQLLWEMRGAAPNRRLIVQWNKWESKASFNWQVHTFQVLLHENGDIEFHYQEMGGNDPAKATGSSATIGLRGNDETQFFQYAKDTAKAVNSGEGFLMYSGPLPATGEVSVSPRAETTYTVSASNSFGSHSAAATLQIGPAAGEVLITEVMANPLVDDGNHEWIELRNLTATAVDLRGFQLTARGGNHVIAAADPVMLPANGYALLAQSAVAAENGGLTNVTYAYGNRVLPLGDSADDLALELGGTPLAEVSYDTAAGWPVQQGRSLQMDGNNRSPVFAQNKLAWCAAAGELAGADLGTPMTANAPCYRWKSVPGAFATIDGVPGTLVLLEGTGQFTQANKVFDLPFNYEYFGKSVDKVGVTRSGLAAFDQFKGSFTTPKALPDPTTPADRMAPFWANLTNKTTTSKVVWAVRGTEPARTVVIEWVGYYLTSSYSDTLQFQVLIGEDGSLEYQYGTLNGTNSLGKTASIGAQAYDGLMSVPFSFNGSTLLTPNTGLRLEHL